MRLRKVLRQNGFGRIEGVPAVVGRDSSKAMVPNRLRKIAMSNCSFKDNMNLLQVDTVTAEASTTAHVNINAIAFLAPGPSPDQTRIRVQNSDELVVKGRLKDIAAEVRELFAEAKRGSLG